MSFPSGVTVWMQQPFSRSVSTFHTSWNGMLDIVR
jgi:hypothetical protein